MSADDAASKAQRTRAGIGAADPGLLDLLDACKATFGARLVAIRAGEVRVGDPDDERYRGAVAVPYLTPKEREEQLHQAAVEARAAAQRKPSQRRRGGVA